MEKMFGTERVIALIDMDCFYVQVESREDKTLRGVPAVVVQYKNWKGGGIIAVNYEARAFGVSRSMRGNDALEKCPDIRLVRVPESRDKADLSKYRNAGREVIEVLLSFGAIVERASVDEAYVDLTQIVEDRMKDAKLERVDISKVANTHLAGVPDHLKSERYETMKDWLEEVESSGNEADKRLAIGAVIVEEMRAAVFERTEFRCSAGIAHCKTLAKLCCGLNKPNKQTICPQSAVPRLYEDLSITKVRGLGGKLGDEVMTELSIDTMGELARVPKSQLLALFKEKTGNWLARLALGFDDEEVNDRNLPKSVGCSKNFRGPEMLDTKEKVYIRLGNLVEEVIGRLEIDKENYNRIATKISVGAKMEGIKFQNRIGTLPSYSFPSVFNVAYGILSKMNQAGPKSEKWRPKILCLSFSTSNFEELDPSNQTITNFFKKKTEEGPSCTPGTTHGTRSTPGTTHGTRSTSHGGTSGTTHGTSGIDNGTSGSTSHGTSGISKNERCNLSEDKGASKTELQDKNHSKKSRKGTKNGYKNAKNRHNSGSKSPILDGESTKGGTNISPILGRRNSTTTSTASTNTSTTSICDTMVSTADSRSTEFNKSSKDSCEIKGEEKPEKPKQTSYFKRIMQEMKEKEEAERAAKEAAEKEAARQAAILAAEEEEAASLQRREDDEESVDDPSSGRGTPSPPLPPQDEDESSMDSFDVREFIPDLENFDPQILKILPPIVRKKASEYVESLKKEKEKRATQTNSSLSKFFQERKSQESNIHLDLQPCPECNKQISAYEMPEHLDFHVAMNISLEDKRLSTGNQVLATPKTGATPNTTARGTKRAQNGSGGVERRNGGVKRKRGGASTPLTNNGGGKTGGGGGKSGGSGGHKDIATFFNKL